MRVGWHAILWYWKFKGHNYVMNHIIRKSLLQSWDEVWFQIYQKIPKWVSSLEAFTQPVFRGTQTLMTYGMLLKQDGTLKMEEKLQKQGVYLDWWMRIQL